MRQEGEDRWVSSLFFGVVTQDVFLFGSESWALSDAMMREVEVTHKGFLIQINGKWSRHQANRNWETLAAVEFLRAEGTNLVANYIGCR